jgi:hypothetical protein
MADHDDRMAARSTVVAIAEQPTEPRLHPHRLEIVPRDQRAVRALGLPGDGDAHGKVVLGDDIHQRRAIAEVAIVRIRPGPVAPLAGFEGDHAKIVRVACSRDRPQQHGLHPGEHGRVGSDAEAQRQHGGQRQSGGLEQRPRGETKVLKEGAHAALDEFAASVVHGVGDRVEKRLRGRDERRFPAVAAVEHVRGRRHTGG